MLQRMTNTSRQESGFTLVELLVVIIIIGILAAIAIPVFLNQRQRANEAALKADIKSMAQAMDSWYVANPNGALPGYAAQGSWSIIRFGPGDGTFLTGGKTATPIPAGFDMPNLSNGSAVGVIARSTEGAPGSFCVAGNMKNSKYEVPPGFVSGGGTSMFSYSLYYDSVAGGLYAPEDLPGGGACNVYYTRIQSGN